MVELENIFSEDYLKRTRAFIELSWVDKREEFLPVLRNIILDNGVEEEWRLRALEILAQWDAAVELPALKKLYFQDDPILIRAIMWFTATVGNSQDILELLCFSATPRGRVIKPETVLGFVTMALQNKKIALEEIDFLAQNNTDIFRYISGWEFIQEEPITYTVYPSADYFALKCRDRGISFKEYKRLQYKNPRYL